MFSVKKKQNILFCIFTSPSDGSQICHAKPYIYKNRDRFSVHFTSLGTSCLCQVESPFAFSAALNLHTFNEFLETFLRDFSSCWYNILGMEWSDTILSLWFSRWGPKSAKNMSPTPLHHWQPEWIHVFTLFALNSDLTIQMLKRVVFLIFWCPGMVSLVELQPHFYVISWQKWHHKAFSPRKLLLTGWFLFL